jgi:uncharacterized protein (DUF885 family)
VRVIRFLFKAFLVLLLVGVLWVGHEWYFKPWSINAFYTRVFAQFALDDPELLSSLGMLDGVGLRFVNDDLTDASIAHDDAQIKKLQEDYDTLKSYDVSDYTGQDKLSYDILDYFLGVQVKGERWRWHNFPVNQMFGVQSSLPNFMAQQHRVQDERGGRDYIARLSKFPVKFAQIIENLRAREAKGVIPPQFVVEKVLTQMQGFIAPPPQENMLYTTFKERLDKIPADKLDEAERTSLLAGVTDQIEKAVYPAYRELIAYFETLKPKATANNGVWSLPDGDAYYRYQVESNTTTTLSPDEIHATGLAEVERIGAEMDRILRDAGYTEGTIGARVRELSASPVQLYPDNDAGRAQILKDYQTIIDEISAGLDPYFATKPKAPVEVVRVPAFAEKTAPGAYYEPASLDGQRPGRFFANLRNVGEIPKFGMRTLSYHEAVPGHHFQIGIAQELKGLPIFRRLVPFTAYAEGWALYSERLAWEAGFQKNPLDNLGRLQAEMFRAVRLVVDTGMHAKRWTREQSIQYMIDNTGMGDDEVTAEIERYLVNPGQALAYKVGMMKILELRERARTALGERFDIREFHDQVLKNGSMPLAILERVIDDYIASNTGASNAGAAKTAE